MKSTPKTKAHRTMVRSESKIWKRSFALAVAIEAVLLIVASFALGEGGADGGGMIFMALQAPASILGLMIDGTSALSKTLLIVVSIVETSFLAFTIYFVQMVFVMRRR